MFTGIIQQLGQVKAIKEVVDTTVGDAASQPIMARQLTIASPVAAAVGTESAATWWRRLNLGDSVACDGCCLTVTAQQARSFEIFASAHTVTNTIIGRYQEGQIINLEQALRPTDAMGGHMVSGHVDTTIPLVARQEVNNSLHLEWRVPSQYAKYVASRGSVGLNGVSLTLADVVDMDNGTDILIVVIPHTQQLTNLGLIQVGDTVNFEIDLLARYVARLQQVNNGREHDRELTPA